MPRRLTTWALVLTALVGAGRASESVQVAAAPPGVPRLVRAVLGLTDRDADRLREGQTVVRTLPGSVKREVVTAGAVFVGAGAGRFVERYRTLEGFRQSSFVLGIGRLSDPPSPSDMAGLALDPDEEKSLGRCVVGDCDVRLAASEVSLFAAPARPRLTGSSDQAQAAFVSMLLDRVARFRAGGVTGLPAYADEEVPMPLADETRALLEASPSPLDTAPELRQHLLQYPAVPLDGVEQLFYWSKEAFGFKPVIGLNHVVFYHAPAGEVFIVTTQIYASHYMDGQVSVSALLPAGGPAQGFYWLYLNRSRIDRLTGVMGALSRPIIQRRARSGLTRSLADTKRRLEAAAAGRPS